MSVFLDGIRLSNYRSYYDEVEFDNLSKINILIGQNNSGKSNLLRFLSRHFLNIENAGATASLDDIYDRPKKENRPVHVAINIKSQGYVFKKIQTELSKRFPELTDYLFENSPSFWYYYKEREKNSFVEDIGIISEIAAQLSLNQRQWQTIQARIPNGQEGNHQHWHKDIFTRLKFCQHFPKKASLIPSTRTLRGYNTPGLVQESGGKYKLNGIEEHGGIGLIEELFVLQNPEHGQDEQKERFEKINDFMRTVTNNSSLKLEIPHTKKQILVNMDGKRLDINSLGAGIEQLLIIAAKSTLFRNQIVCIEEPEIYLHPTLQRKLLQFLHDETDNQYFIATHSAHLMDATESSVYHIKLEDGYSKVIASLSSQEKFEACRDLGYRASDLLQSNCIVWVEGPSDKIHVNHWIKSLAPDLKEDLHYSIMFYGGKLLSHLTNEDDTAFKDFIKIQYLNRNMAIIMDSDKESNSVRINKTKARIRKEFEDKQHHVWITAGREIENYIPDKIYRDTVKKLHANIRVLPTYGQYEKITEYWTSPRKTKESKKTLDKIALAHSIGEREPAWEHLDLRSQVNDLVKYIKKANLYKT